MSFKLPPNHQQLYAEVYSRCLALIDLGYWTRIDKSILDDWLSNFTNKEEKFFAIQILFHFKFRNNKTIISMFNQIIQVLLPQKLEELNIYKINSISDWEKTLKTSDKELFKLPFRFSTINKKGAIGESGDALFRLMAQKNILNKKLGRFIDSITSECKVVILIDDITGSGGQFIDFFNRYKENFNQFDYIIYAPLIAHIEAIDKLTKLDNRIHIITSEILTKEESFYKIFDENNSNERYLEFTKKIIKDKRLKIKFPLGYSEQAILYGLELSTPNNNHSFVYHDIEWYPLLRR